MAFEVGSVIAHVKADLTDFNNGLNQAKHNANGFSSHLSGLGDSIANFGKQAAVFTGVVAAGLTVAGKMALDYAGKYEQYQIAFTTLLKDEKKAGEAILQIQKDAAATPFEMAPLIMGNQRLISAGVSAKQARVDIINLGNAISATGGGNAELERLSTNLQQIKAVGKASALDIKQFAFAGINVYQMLADSMGKNVEQIKEMDISYDDLTKAFARASDKGGMFEGAMQKQSRSLNGMISTLKDVVNIGLKDILVNSGAFDMIKRALEALIPFLQNVAVPAIVGFFNELAKGHDSSNQFVQIIMVFVDALMVVVGWIQEHQELVTTFLKGLAIAIGALLIVGAVAAAIAALTNPLVWVALAIAALFTAWETNFLGIRDITTAVFNVIMDVINNYVMPVINAFRDFITENWTTIQMITQAVWDMISGYFKLWWAIVSGLFKIFIALLKGDWQGAWEAIKEMVTKAWDAIKQIFNGALNFIKGWGGWLLDELTRPFRDAWNRISEYVNKIKDALDFTKRHSPSVVDIVKTGVKQVNRAMEGLEFNTSLTPNVAAAVVGGSTGGTNVANVTVDMSGAIISDELAAMRIGEKIGDSIIGKLKLNVRF
jgi:tape measure domain-containing protein